MDRIRIFIALAIVATLNAACAVVSTEGEQTIAPGRFVVGNVISTSGVVTIESGARVTGCVFITSGVLTIQPGAEIWGDVVMTSGIARVMPGAIVRGQVVYTSGTVDTTGARVDGGVSRDIIGWTFASLFKYCVLPSCLLVVLVFAAFFVIARRKPRAPAAPMPPGAI